MLAPLACAHDRHGETPLAPGYAALGFPAPVPGTYTLPDLGAAADGDVLDTQGRPQRLHALYAGKIVLLAFVYTHCDDVNGCPLATHVLAQLQTRIARDPALMAAVRTLSLSFDPARDTPQALAAFSAGLNRGSDWRFLTTRSQAELAPLLAAYDQAVVRDIDADGKPLGTISHVLRVFLIDRNRRIRNIYSASFLHADTVAADLRSVLLGSASTRAGAPTPTANANLPALPARARLGLPKSPADADASAGRARIDLGRKLFFDRRLSHNGTLSCALCHVPEQGFTRNDMRTAVGIEGRTVRRNTPTLLNVGYAQPLFHDGRESRLEQQVWSPLLAANEMGNPSIGHVIAKIDSLPDYRGLFQAAFDGTGATMETIGAALAAYQRILVAGSSPFDRWHYGGETHALSAAAQRGYALFAGKAGCGQCHLVGAASALFSDGGFHNTGIGYSRAMARPQTVQTVRVAPDTLLSVRADVVAAAAETPPADLGRYEITLDPQDRWKYRTPNLRNVALTAPYMHDGSLPTLAAVVAFYDRGGIANENLDPRLKPLRLDTREQADLVAFLEALTGANVEALIDDARAAPVGNPH